MIKKIFVLSICILSIGSVYAEWETEIAAYFGEPKDYRGATEYLISHFEKIEIFDKPAACGLLAYAFHKLKDQPNEHRWLVEYFETYKAQPILFHFLDDSTRPEISNYLESWKGRYPWITEIFLIISHKNRHSLSSSSLLVGIDILNPAYYKLSDKREVIEGGLFNRGLNTIRIDPENLFEKSGIRPYFLDLKAGSMILQKEIRLDINIASKYSVKQADEQYKDIECTLSMYVEGELIVSSKKMKKTRLGLNLEMPPTPVQYDPEYPLHRSDPFLHSFSILDVLAGTASLLYRVFRDREKEPAAKQEITFKKGQQVTITFRSKGIEEAGGEVRAIVKLTTRKSKVVFQESLQ